MNSKLIARMQHVKRWQLNLYIVLSSLALSELCVAILSQLIFGEVRLFALQITLIVTLVASPILALIFTHLLDEISKAQLQNVENAAQRTRLNLEMAIEAAQMDLWEFDLTTYAIKYNTARIKIPGFTADEPPRNLQDWLTSIHPDDSGPFQQRMQQAMLPGASNFDFEYRVSLNAGQWAWVHTRGGIIQRDASGKPLLAAGSTINITERKVAEIEEQEANNRFAHFFNNNPDLMLISRLSDGRITDVNDVFVRASGYSREEALGNTTIGLGFWSNTFDRERMIRELQTKGICDHLEAEFHPKSAPSIMGSLSAVIIKPNGVPHILSTLRDISIEKKAEEKIKQSATLLRTTLESTDEGILMIGHEGRILSANKRFMELWRVPQSLLEKGDDNLLLPHALEQLNDPEDFLGLVRKLYTSDEQARDVLHFKDGRVFARFTQALAVGEERGRIWCFKDITEQHHTEQELRTIKERYDFATKVGKVGTWDWSPVTGQLFWSDETFRLMGFEPDSITPTYELYLGLVHPDDRELLSDSVQAALQKKKPYALDCRINLGNGAEIVCHVTGKVEFDENGQPTRMLGTIQDVTARKKVELTLAENEHRLNLALDSAHMGVWEYDFAHDTLFWSPEIYRQFKLSGVTPSRELLMQMMHPDDVTIPQAAMDSALSQHTPYHAIYRVLVDGQMIWVEDRGEINYDEQGRPLKVVGTAQDITARKQAEIELRASEQKMLTILDNVDAYIYLKDPEGKYLFANRRVRELWGVEMEDIVGFGDEKFFDEATTLQIRTNDREVLDKGETHTTEENNTVLATGQSFTYLSTKLPLRRADGAIYALCGVSTDISEIKNINRKLEENGLFLNSLLSAIPLPVFYKDIEGRYLGVNQAFERFHQKSSEAFIGKTVYDSAPKELADIYFKHDRELMESGGSEIYESQIKIVDGTMRDVVFHKASFKDASGKVSGLIGGILDITERKRAEEHAKGLANLLRLITDNVTDMIWAKDLDQRYLFANKAMCEKLFNAKDTNEPIGKDDMFFAMRERNSHPDAPDWHTFGELCQDSDTITLQNGKASQFDEYGNVKGEFLFLDVHKAPFINDKGEVIGVVGSGRDVTQQKVIEEKLRLASMVLENSSEAMFITDEKDTIIEVNPAFILLTGYSMDEVIGKSPKLLRSGKHDAAFYAAMQKELKQTGHWQGEIWNRRKNGEIYAEWQTINTIYNDDGTVHRHVALFSDITEKKKSEELIWAQANFDQLTGLPNRRMFRDRLTQDIKKAHRAGLGLALMFLDLDRFKEVNDSLGHDTGDALLIEAAQRIAACVRESDTVARLGGDEFTIILAELDDRASVERIATDILRSLSRPFEFGDDVAYVSASIGITLYPEDATNLDDMLKNADQAMYVAKNAGRNRFSYFTNAMQERALYRLHIMNDLRSALVEQQLQLHYQPIVDIQTGRIHKAEALLRWFHPKRGLISPEEFIPLAEESGLIHEIGDWVFEQAVTQTLKWTTQYGSDFQISVNKSPIQIQTKSERCRWKEHLAKTGLSGKNLVIEITEGVLLDHTPAVISELLAFRDAGIQVAIDDFGTGYSALSYLKKLDIDYVKIDQSFILNLEADDNDKALAEAIVVMAHKLGLKVIAEGVETQQQLDLLASMGCDYAQGFLYSRALTPADFARLMERQRG